MRENDNGTEDSYLLLILTSHIAPILLSKLEAENIVNLTTTYPELKVDDNFMAHLQSIVRRVTDYTEMSVLLTCLPELVSQYSPEEFNMLLERAGRGFDVNLTGAIHSFTSSLVTYCIGQIASKCSLLCPSEQSGKEEAVEVNRDKLVMQSYGLNKFRDFFKKPLTEKILPSEYMTTIKFVVTSFSIPSYPHSVPMEPDNILSVDIKIIHEAYETSPHQLSRYIHEQLKEKYEQTSQHINFNNSHNRITVIVLSF